MPGSFPIFIPKHILSCREENRRVNQHSEKGQRPYVSLFPRSQSMGNLFKKKMACHAVALKFKTFLK